MEWEVLQEQDRIWRQDTAELLTSKHYADIPLRYDDMKPIYKYAYYVHLRLHEAWRVPVLHGKLPGPPHADATAYQKGSYGLMMLFLFKPHRTP